MLRRLPSPSAAPKSPARFRPCVEALGERVVPVLSPLANANPLSGDLVKAVGEVKGIDFQKGTPYHGTGTLISDRWVLTAAHIVDSSWTENLSFVVNGASYTADERFAVTAMNFDPNWDYRNYDIGLIHLTQSVPGVTPIPFYRGGIKAGQALTLVGYGDTDNGTHTEIEGTGTQRRAGIIVVDDTPRTDEGDQTILRTVYGQDAGGALSGHGDSGGPLLGVVGGRVCVVGVVSHLNGNLGPYVHGTGDDLLATTGSVVDNMRVAPFGEWLDWVMGTQSYPGTRWVANTGGPGELDPAAPLLNLDPVLRPPDYACRANATLHASAPGVLERATDPNGLPLQARLVAGPAHGQLTFNPDGSFTYTPDRDFYGADSFTVQASDGVYVSGPAQVSIDVSDDPSLNVYAGNAQHVPVAGHYGDLVARVLDSYGHPVVGTPVTFFVYSPWTGAGGTFANGSTHLTVSTDANGLATISGFTANTVPGGFYVDMVTPGVGSSRSFVCENVPGPASRIVVTGGSSQSTRVNTAFGSPLRVVVTDAYGNPLSAAPWYDYSIPPVTLTFTAPSGGAGGAFGDRTVTTALTDVDGVAVAPSFTANGTAGSYQVTVTAPGLSPATLTLTNTGPASVGVVATPPAAAAGVPFAAPLRARVLDQDGRPLASVRVTFRAPTSGPTGAFGGSDTFVTTTDADGVASAPLTAGSRAGAFNVTATADGVAEAATFRLSVVAGPAARVEVSGGDGQSARVNSAFARRLAGRLTDAFGNPTSGAVTFAAPAGGPGGTFGGQASVTVLAAGDGVATAPAFTANGAPGDFRVTAAVAGLDPVSFDLRNTPPAPPRPVRVVLFSQPWGLRKRLVARVFFAPEPVVISPGVVVLVARPPRDVVSPLQPPSFRRVAVGLRDLDGDGTNDALVFTALRGRQRVSRIVRL